MVYGPAWTVCGPFSLKLCGLACFADPPICLSWGHETLLSPRSGICTGDTAICVRTTNGRSYCSGT